MISKCECVESPEYEAWRLRIKDHSFDERIDNALGIGSDPMPEQYPVLCDHCKYVVMVGQVCRSLDFPMDDDGHLPYLKFNEWHDPEPDDFVLLFETNRDQMIQTAKRNLTRDEDDREPGGSHAERMRLWSGIDNLETFLSYIEIGYWISTDRAMQNMDEEELRNFKQNRTNAANKADEFLNSEEMQRILGKIQQKLDIDDEFDFEI